MVGPAVEQGPPISSHLPTGTGTGRVQCLVHRLTFICGIFSSNLTLQSCEYQARRSLIAGVGWGGHCKGLRYPRDRFLSINVHQAQVALPTPTSILGRSCSLPSGVSLSEATPWHGSVWKLPGVPAHHIQSGFSWPLPPLPQ